MHMYSRVAGGRKKNAVEEWRGRLTQKGWEKEEVWTNVAGEFPRFNDHTHLCIDIIDPNKFGFVWSLWNDGVPRWTVLSPVKNQPHHIHTCKSQHSHYTSVHVAMSLLTELCLTALVWHGMLSPLMQCSDSHSSVSKFALTQSPCKQNTQGNSHRLIWCLARHTSCEQDFEYIVHPSCKPSW